jgi:hypothetical protein
VAGEREIHTLLGSFGLIPMLELAVITESAVSSFRPAVALFAGATGVLVSMLPPTFAADFALAGFGIVRGEPLVLRSRWTHFVLECGCDLMWAGRYLGFKWIGTLERKRGSK